MADHLLSLLVTDDQLADARRLGVAWADAHPDAVTPTIRDLPNAELALIGDRTHVSTMGIAALGNAFTAAAVERLAEIQEPETNEEEPNHG